MKKQKKVPAKLVAKAVVESTQAGQALTVREKEYAAAVVAGEGNPKSEMMERPMVQQAIMETLSKIGVDIDYLSSHIKDGLEATKLYGKEAIEAADWGARHRYLTTTLELAGVKSKDKPAGPLHLHYHSKLGPKPETIKVGESKTDAIQRRMNSHKPTNRGGK